MLQSDDAFVGVYSQGFHGYFLSLTEDFSSGSTSLYPGDLVTKFGGLG